MTDVKLANILFTPTATTREHPELFYRCIESIQEARDQNGYILCSQNRYDFATYFNALSLKKWKRYTCVENVFLHLEIKGEFSLGFIELTKDNTPKNKEEKTTYSCKDFEILDIEIPLADAELIAFIIDTKSECIVRCAWYASSIPTSCLKPTRISIAMTTFNNEKYLMPNIKLFKELLASDDPIAKSLNVHIVDNGRSLDNNRYSADHIFIHPNKNVGGSGGFTRGIMESLAETEQPTHVLLMDDDVSVSPESLKRTYNLLSLRNEHYENACVSGAMLKMEDPNIQYEDVGYVRKDGCYAMAKPLINTSKVSDIVKNENLSTEIPGAYGAWWYFCIPTTLIRHHGLPLPLFIRCDDVEYGMRLKPTIMTMNGICVWHAAFGGRFRASVDHYQYTRNFLIANAINDASSARLFMLRLRRSFHQEVNTFGYDNAELLLDGLEDYLRGPDFIKQDRGAQLMGENGAKNEKLLPLAEIEERIGLPLISLHQPQGDAMMTRDVAPGNKASRFLSSFTHNPHKISATRLNDKPVIVSYDGQSYLDAITQHSTRVVALNTEAQTAALRLMDTNRYKELTQRYATLMAEYRRRKKHVARAYKAALPGLCSDAFWKTYLELDK
ncbi:MAG: glycosyltransferase [Raoultibacter sp.]